MRLATLLAACSILAFATAASAAETAPSPPPEAASYAKPHQLVDIGGGRKLNLYCMGDHGPTVLFDAGGSDWSVVWAMVQPAIAKEARACAYDRAGMGYSDPARGPRTPAAIADDLHELIKAAKLPGPAVLVGHSLGGFNVKLHAALYPEDVSGLVLVDPADERTWDRTRDAMRAKYGERVAARAELADLQFIGFLMNRYKECAEAVRSGPLDPQSITYKRCSDPVRPQLGPEVAAERLRIQVTPAYQNAQASEIANSVYGTEAPNSVYARLLHPGSLGSIPIVVLTHGNPSDGDELDALGDAQGLELHRQDARLSSRGVQRTVPKTDHHIELEAPQAIVQAVREVIALSAAKR